MFRHTVRAMQRPRFQKFARFAATSAAGYAAGKYISTLLKKKRAVGRVRLRFARKKYAPTRGKFTGLNDRKTFVHGRRVKINPRFIKKVKEAASNVNIQQFRSVNSEASSIGQCAYWGSPQLYSAPDILTIATNIGANPVGNCKYLIKDVTMQTQIQNCSSGLCSLTVWEATCREDFPNTSDANTNQKLLNEGWTLGGVAANKTDISSMPYSSSSYVRQYKLSKPITFMMQPGEILKLGIIDKSPNNINTARWFHSDDTARILGQRRRSKHLLFKFYGQPINDSVNKTNVSVDACKLNFVTTLRYNVCWSNDDTTTIYASGATQDFNGTSTDLQAIANAAEYVNQLTGAVITDAES